MCMTYVLPAGLLLLAFLCLQHTLANSDDYCRYEFHFWPLSWLQAQEICAKKNSTLAKLTNLTEHKVVASMATSVSSLVTDRHNMSSQLWIGLRGESVLGTIQHQWEDCDHLEPQSAFQPWRDVNEKSSVGCVAFDTNSSHYIVNDCDQSLPFVCEAPSAVPCYQISTHIKEFRYFTELNAAVGDCEHECNVSSQCIGFQSVSPDCKLLQYRPIDGVPLNVRFNYTMKGYIEHSSYPPFTVVAPPPQSFCSNYLTPEPQSSSITPLLPEVSGTISTSPISTPGSVYPSQSVCYCPCSQYSNKTYTKEELQSRIEQIKKELTINVKETNNYQRSLISAPDDRTSAQSIGYVGLAILIVVCLLLVLIDMPRCVVHCKDFVHKCR